MCRFTHPLAALGSVIWPESGRRNYQMAATADRHRRPANNAWNTLSRITYEPHDVTAPKS
jgi:hypothetical protein